MKKNSEENLTYIVVTNDRYRLPVFYADTKEEIAKRYGVTKDAVAKAIKRDSTFHHKRYRIEVFLEGQEDD